MVIRQLQVRRRTGKFTGQRPTFYCCVYRGALLILIDLYLHAKFHWNQRNFLWTDGRMDGHL